jgi:hypothetical protein
VADEVDFSLAVGGPEVDVEDEHAMVDVTEDVSWYFARAYYTTHLQSTSFPVAISVITRRTQGGGVMGRRSYSCQLEKMRLSCLRTLSPKPHILARRGCCTTWSLGIISSFPSGSQDHILVFPSVLYTGTR